MAPVSEFSSPTETKAQGKEAALSNASYSYVWPVLHGGYWTKAFSKKEGSGQLQLLHIVLLYLGKKLTWEACLEKWQFMKSQHGKLNCLWQDTQELCKIGPLQIIQ